MKSTNTEVYVKGKHEKAKVFRLDHERRAVKVKFEPPRSFQTAYKDLFSDKTGTKVVGDPNLGKTSPMKPTTGKYESIDCIVPKSSYASSFGFYGQVPQGI